MSGEWKTSPVAAIVLMAVILVVAATFFFRPTPAPDPQQKALAGNLQFAVGWIAAEEAANLMDKKGATVAIILPGNHDKPLRESSADYFERGFKEALKTLPFVSYAGALGAWQPFPQNHHAVMEQVTLGTLQAARERFPDAQVLVSFIGVPHLQMEEVEQWRRSSPPALLAVQNAPPPNDLLDRLFRQQVVSVVLHRVQDFPAAEPQGNPKTLFEQYYRRLTPANPKLSQ